MARPRDSTSRAPVLAPTPGHSSGRELHLRGTRGEVEAEAWSWGEPGQGGDMSSQAPWIPFILMLLAAGNRLKVVVELSLFFLEM